jgi:hypothetical protein
VVVVGLALSTLAVAQGCAADDGPEIDAVTPAQATRGSTVMLKGARLCGSQNNCVDAAGEVDIGLEPPMVRASIVSYSNTAAAVQIPSVTPVGATALIVTVDEHSSNAIAFTVLP